MQMQAEYILAVAHIQINSGNEQKQLLFYTVLWYKLLWLSTQAVI